MIDIPLIGLGTWRNNGEKCRNAVSMALDIGYRHFDTAFAYENHKEIGQAIKGFDREKLFLTSKISLGIGEGALSHTQIDRDHLKASVIETCDLALKELDIDYLDLMMIHWPSKDWPTIEILMALQKVIDSGKLRFLGGSNFTKHHLQDVYDAGLPFHFVQVEYHPLLNQEDLLKFAAIHGTQLISYRPFGKGKLPLEEPRLGEIGEKYGKSPNQVILRWLIQKEIPTIPKATSREHLEENFAIFDFKLSNEDMESINQLNQNKRYCAGEGNEFNY